MFKRVIESISKSLGGSKAPAKPPTKPNLAPSKSTAAPAFGPAAAPSKVSSLLEKVAGVKPHSARSSTPEDLCEITPRMSKDEIRARLKLLYRRYNRAASSLDNTVRAEADKMLDAIVAIREKHFGEI